MHLELTSASNFLVHLVRLSRCRNINEGQLDKFRNALIEVLKRRYRDHWFPEKPFKGSGYRCIRINGFIDPVLSQAGESCKLSMNLLLQTFPSELTMWIDPQEVSYRIGENGSICVLYEHKEGVTEPWKPQSQLLKEKQEKENESKQHKAEKEKQEKTNTTTTTAKESLRNIDYLLDPRKSVPVNNSSSSKKNEKENNNKTTDQQDKSSSCKESLRNIDYLLDPRKSVSIEQLAAYVSS